MKFFRIEEGQETAILLLEYMEGVRNILLFINLRDTSSILADKDGDVSSSCLLSVLVNVSFQCNTTDLQSNPEV